jgi:hypothetical protein
MISLILAAAVAVSPTCDLERPSGAAGCTRKAVNALPMSAMQVVGTHNSYKQAISPAEMALLRKTAPAAAVTLDYAHRPLAEQLNGGARQLELDLFYDPEGGRYAAPIGQKIPGAAPYDLSGLRAPGLKVMHAQDIDYRSNCQLFADCLRQIRNWSAAHPDHVPIAILLNLKEDELRSVPGATPAARFDAAGMAAVDAEIRAVFGARSLITPAQVRSGGGARWPTLGKARGKVFFALDAGPEQVERYRAAVEARGEGGGVLFPNGDESALDAAYLTLNEPVELMARIKGATARGQIVRTRADADTREARSGDTGRREAALASGAQYVSTDYMTPDPRLGSYTARLPGGMIARLRPGWRPAR